MLTLPMAFLIGHIMRNAFRLGESAAFARSEQMLLLAPPSRTGVHGCLNVDLAATSESHKCLCTTLVLWSDGEDYGNQWQKTRLESK